MHVDRSRDWSIAAFVDLAIMREFGFSVSCMHAYSITNREIPYSPVLHIGGRAELAFEQKFRACHP